MGHHPAICRSSNRCQGNSIRDRLVREASKVGQTHVARLYRPASNPREEKLDLPAFLVDSSNRPRSKVEDVRQQHDLVPVLLVLHNDATQRVRTFLLGIDSSRPNGLVLEHTPPLRDLVLLHYLVDSEPEFSWELFWMRVNAAFE